MTLNMSKVEMLRVVVIERLTAAAEEIFGVFERTVAEYEEQLSRSKLENQRQRRLLDAVLKPEVRLHRTVLSADFQQDPEPPNTTQLWSTQEGEQLQGPVPEKNEDDKEKAPSTKLHHRQTEENREPPACSSAQPMETESDGEDRAESEPTRSLDPDNCLQTADDDETQYSSKQADTVKSKGTQTAVSVSQPAKDYRTSVTSEPKTENSDGEWKETRKPQSDLKTLTNNGILQGGKECNTSKKSHSCFKCGKAFEPKDCVQTRRKTPTGEKPFVCSVCVQQTTQSAHVVTHKRTHSGGKKFRCSLCMKQFNYKGDVVRHIRIHTGERPFSCTVCGKSFRQSTTLSSHMRTHTGEKPFSCSLCPKRFIRSGVLARHLRVHTGEKPYSCAVCKTRFTHSQSLLKHMRIHTGEKPFKCSVCDKKFTQKGHLTQHMILHTGEKSFSCRVCGRKFTRQSSVKRHKCVTKSSSSK